MKRRRGLPGDWKETAARIFHEHPGWNAAQLQRQLEVYYGQKNTPKLSAVQKERQALVKSGAGLGGREDEAWSMGADRKYTMPLEALPRVLALQEQFIAHGRYLTIRRTRWIVGLYAVLGSLLPERDLRLAQIAAFYSRAEQIAEMNGEDYADTTDLDRQFLIIKDVSFAAVTREWHSTYGGSVEPSGNETGKLAEFVSLLLEKGAEAAIAYAEAHPDVQPQAIEWMVFSTRKEGQK